MIGVEIAFPAADQRDFYNQMQRRSALLKKPLRESIGWAATMIAKSMAASTKVSSKTRPIVENPHPMAGIDWRRARVGVEAYSRDRATRFVPIFTDHKAMTLDEAKRAARTSPKRAIRRSGLAKRSWQWQARHAKKGGTATLMDGIQAGWARYSGGQYNMTVTLDNALRYAADALRDQPEKMTAERAMGRAASAMRHAIDAQLERLAK